MTNQLILASLIVINVAACDTQTPDPDQVYDCVGTFVCNDVESTYPGSVCTDADGAQDQVDGWVDQCDETAVESGCATYSCYDNCTPTGDSC